MSALTPTRSQSLVARVTRLDYVDLVFALVFVWGAGDLLSTLVAVNFAGIGAKQNPLVRTLLVISPLLLIALKMGVVLSVALTLLASRSLVERVPLWRPWLATVVGVGAVVGTVRRRALPEGARFDLSTVVQRAGTDSLLPDDSATALLTLGLCCMVVVALGAFSVAIAGPSQSMSYTSASLLTTGQNGEPVASGYPANVSQGESVPLVVRVTNHHDTAANYTVVTRLQRVEGGTVQSGQRVWQGRQRIGVNETWTKNHTVTLRFAGQDLRLTYFVYRGSVPGTVSQSTADEVLYLRLDVFPDGERNPQPLARNTPQG